MIDEARRAYHRAWYQKNREKAKESKRRWIENNPEKRRDVVLKNKYGITLDEYNALLEKQNGLCAICDEPMKQPNVDHDHNDNHVRGLLCWRCNASIGKFNEDPALLEKAARYLRTH